MKKTKKIVSTILGLLSAFSFKSSAMGIDYDDDELKNEDDLYSELDNQKSIVSLLLLAAAVYGLYSEFLKKEFDTGQRLLNLYGERLTRHLKNNDIIEERKKFNERFPQLGQFLRDDLLIKSLVCNYCAAENLKVLADYSLKGEYLGFGELIGELNCSEELKSGYTLVVERVIAKLVDFATNHEKNDINMLPFAIAILKSFAELGYVKKIDGDNVKAGSDNSRAIAEKAVNLIKKLIDEEIKKINNTNGKKAVKIYMSYILCALGLPIWNQLYPNKKEYDEGEYLRLQKQLCIMLPWHGGACR